MKILLQLVDINKIKKNKNILKKVLRVMENFLSLHS